MFIISGPGLQISAAKIVRMYTFTASLQQFYQWSNNTSASKDDFYHHPAAEKAWGKCPCFPLAATAHITVSASCVVYLASTALVAEPATPTRSCASTLWWLPYFSSSSIDETIKLIKWLTWSNLVWTTFRILISVLIFRSHRLKVFFMIFKTSPLWIFYAQAELQ